MFRDLSISFGAKLLAAIIALYLGFKIVTFINRRIEKIFEKTDFDPMMEGFIESAVSILLKVFVLLTAAGIVGIETSSFMAIFAAAGLAIGMALSGTLQNFAG